LPRSPPPRAVRRVEPLDRVRRRHLPPQGPARQRLPARPHARGDVHPAGEGPLLVVQGPAAVHLPDPDEVPRRGAPAGGIASTTPGSTARTRRTATPTSPRSTGSGSPT